jgi:hypothetical protein
LLKTDRAAGGTSTPSNLDVARRLEEVADLLEEQKANQYRVDAYRRAAYTLRHLGRPVTQLLQQSGIEALEELPGIGEALARAIREYVVTGRLPMLERLRGEVAPEALLASVPGIGEVLAERLHHELGIETLHDLEAAAYDGRLDDVPGLGEKRLAGIKAVLSTRLGRFRYRPPAEAGEPAVGELLDVDREYRQGAYAGTLRRIAPRRLNPTGEAWLPVLHTHRASRDYTALYSNTERAHRLGKTRDWVVLYYDETKDGGQCTVITSERGPLKGRRIIRGREAECLRFYHMAESATAG